MFIISEPKYSGLRQGIGYLKLECKKEDVNELTNRVEDIFGVKLKGNKAPHISIVRDEPIPFIKYWYKYKEPIGVKLIDDSIYTDGRFYWVDVTCHYVDLIRSELGLNRKPNIPLHLTLGYK